MKSDSMKLDHKAILEMIPSGSSVLDLGCGEGDLLYLLIKEKKVKGQGIDIDEQAIYKCVAKGLSVYHGDIDSGLTDYSDESFDFVILNQSLQQVRHLESVLDDSLRVGKKVIVGFPNFAYYKARYQMFFKGQAPVTPALPYQWYDSPNLHFLSISDFLGYCKKKKIRVEETRFIGKNGMVKVFPNLCANMGIFLISSH